MTTAWWNWAREHHNDLPPNPCIGVRLNKQGIRDRYATDVELKQYKALCSHRSMLPLAMEIGYLCRLRANEVYKLKKEYVLKQGLRVFRGKGSKGEVTKWTPRLRAAVDDCLRWYGDIDSVWLIHDKKGQKYTMSNHNSQFQRVQQKADKMGYERFTFHDLKAKGYSDQESPDAGHLSPKMHAVYDRKGRLVVPADGELDFGE